MDKIIVTLRDKKKRFTSYDIEIPTSVLIKTLKKDIVETLNSYNKTLKLSDYGVILSCERIGRTLNDSETAETAGLWNGDLLFFDD